MLLMVMRPEKTFSRLFQGCQVEPCKHPQPYQEKGDKRWAENTGISGLFQTDDTSRPISMKVADQQPPSMRTGEEWALFRCFFALIDVPWNKTKPLD